MVVAGLRFMYTTSVTPAVRLKVLRNHCRWSVHFTGHHNKSGVVQSFGDKTSLQAPLNWAAYVAGVDYGEVGKHVLITNDLPGGYNVIFFDTTVEKRPSCNHRGTR